jgi:acyl dehydratase
LHQAAIRQATVAFTQAQKMHGVQDIGFPHPVESGKTIQARRKLQPGGCDIFKMGDMQAVQIQNATNVGASRDFFLLVAVVLKKAHFICRSGRIFAGRVGHAFSSK